MPKNRYVLNLIITLTFGFVIMLGSNAHAEKITPSNVFQVTEDIIAQLNRMLDANLTKADFTKTRLEIPERLPRHVLQQGLNVQSKIQVLKRVNGLEISEITPRAVKEVTPEDVLSLSETILGELVDFDKAFGLTPFKKKAKLVEGKTPTDVYINMLRAETMITQLGIPATVPNEVYSTAVSVSQEIEYLRIDKGKIEPIEPPSASIGKKPADAYTLAYYALKGLQGLSKKKEYTIAKAVILPEKLKKGITPSDVQQLLIYCLAELSSMKVSAGLRDKLMPPRPTAGQTPSTVFDQLGLVNTQIQSLAW